MTKGPYAYDFGDTAHLTPLVKMHTLGSTFVPAGIHAGGLRYHGMAPLVSHLAQLKQIEAVAINQLETFAAGVKFARTEGIFACARVEPCYCSYHPRSAALQRRRQEPSHSVQPVRARPL